MVLKSFPEAVAYILAQIPQTKEMTFPGELGWERTKDIMNRLGNPQNSLKIVHVAGTSGKGSTCTLISTILQSQGFTVGLNLSPHIVDIRERVQINNALIDREAFVKYLNSIIPVIEETRQTRFGNPTYFDVITALAFTAFADKNVDYAVIETGLGGLLDGTNVITRQDKTAVITKIGLDHMSVLGSSEEIIAVQKAGIIHSGNKVFTIEQKPSVEQVFTQKAQEMNAQITIVPEPKEVMVTADGISFDFEAGNWKLPSLHIGLKGDFQAENAALALNVCKYILERERIQLNEAALRKYLTSVQFGGRFEERTYKGQTIILDGAHNPQKMRAFITALKHRYPQSKHTIVLACKEGKDIGEMIPILLPVAGHIILTTFNNSGNDLIHTSTDPGQLAQILEDNSFSSYEIIPDLRNVLKRIEREPGSYVITGSLYLIGEVAALIQAET